ncbi:MAG: hypothetical protein HY420_03590 [Candidatus Kerfeldbacteria bacterium]|nr:hypothetical protein [Candidatus Kerfeldbacteria bacterium]
MIFFQRRNSTQRLVSSLQGLTRVLLALAVFSVPLFFLPGLTDLHELPKAALFLVLTLLAGLSWTATWVISGELRWRPIPGQWPLLALAIVVVLSTIFSIGHVASLLGVSAFVHQTLPVLLAAIVFLMLIGQVFDGVNDVDFFVALITTSLGLAGLIGMLQIAGLSPFSLVELRSPNFLPTANSLAAFGILMGALASLCLMSFNQPRELRWRVLTATGMVVAVIGLLAVDVPAGWISLLISMVVSIVFVSLRRLARVELLVSGLIVIIAVVGLLLPTNRFVKSGLQTDVVLDSAASWSITKASLKAYPILGSGPATFMYDYVRFRPAAVRGNPLVMPTASDDGLQVLATLGLLGALALLSVIIGLLLKFIRQSEQLADDHGQQWSSISSLIGVWAGVTAALVFAPSTMTTFVLWWATTAFVSVVVKTKVRTQIFKRTAGRLLSPLSFLVITAAFGFVLVWSIRLVLADRGLNQVAAALSRQEDLSIIGQRIDRTIRLNPSAALPWLFRSQNQLIQAQLLSQSSSPDRAKIQNLIAQAINDAETAVSRDPGNPLVLESVAQLYKNIANGGDLLLSAFERLVKLEPNNPQLRLDLGQAHYLRASSLYAQKGNSASDPEVQKSIIVSRSEFETVFNLQPNNLEGSFGLVLLDELAGEKDTAFNRLEALTKANPTMAALWYELGLRYKDRKDAKSAKDAFTSAAQLQPGLAQAHWELGLLAEADKDTATARQEFEIVQQLDPTNTEVGKKLEGLPKQ